VRDERGFLRQKNWWLVVGGAVVIALVVLLIIKLTNDSGASMARRSASNRTDDSPADPLRTRPRQTDTSPATPSDPVRETVVDGVLVRDHRKGDHPIPELPIHTRPPDRRRLASHLVQDISGKLQVVMKECTSAIPAAARGAKPKLEGVVFVDIKAGELKVIEASVQLGDITGDTTAARLCIEQKAVGQTIAAKGVEDTTRYSITLAFAVPAP
jgi:hypothetical protein